MSTRCSFDKTPITIISYILQFLSVSEWLINCVRVSKSMRQSVSTPMLWKDVLLMITTGFFGIEDDERKCLNEENNHRILLMHPDQAKGKWCCRMDLLWAQWIGKISWDLTQDNFGWIQHFFTEENVQRMLKQLETNASRIQSFHLVMSTTSILVEGINMLSRKQISGEECVPFISQFKNLKTFCLQFINASTLDESSNKSEVWLEKLQMPFGLSTLSLYGCIYGIKSFGDRFYAANATVFENLHCLELFSSVSTTFLSKSAVWNNLQQLTICNNTLYVIAPLYIPATVHTLTLKKVAFQCVVFSEPKNILRLHLLQCEIISTQFAQMIDSLDHLQEMHFLSNVISGSNLSTICFLFYEIWIPRQQCVSFLCDKAIFYPISLEFCALSPFWQTRVEIHIACLRRFMKEHYLQSDNTGKLACTASLALDAFQLIVQ